MSLTSELADPASPVTRFLKRAVPLVSEGKRNGRYEASAKRVLGLDALPSKRLAAPVAGANPGTVGTAFDYRFRYALEPCDPRQFVAKLGAANVIVAHPKARNAIEWFFKNLDQLTDDLKPWARQLTTNQDDLLARYCVILALFEAVFRSGYYMIEMPTTRRKQSTPAKEPLLALASDQLAQDVVGVMRVATATVDELKLLISRGLLYKPNPTFTGSGSIGGADADFTLGDTLYELKTVRSLTPAAFREALIQMVGYALLDYSDSFGIRNIAVYFGRFGWMDTIPLWQLLVPPLDVVKFQVTGNQPGEEEVNDLLRDLRREMAEAVKGAARAISNLQGE